MTAVLEASGLAKSYAGEDGGTVDVLAGLDLAVARGEFIAITGASGVGKSTLLHCLGALDRPTAGTVRLDGVDVGSLTPPALAALRNQRIGFIFQFHHLLREFSALENVMMPLLIAGRPEDEARSRAAEALEAMGLTPRAAHRPAKLSGGEQQRVAVARAVVIRPSVVLADEPSGNLDAHNAERLHDLFATLGSRFGTAVVAVTHNPALAQRADRVLSLVEGRLVDAAPRPTDA
ncbi:MAG TPA: ABC transporter ATP-binding protein [Anaeromyxobacteraceae bacterium]|nr:ABC transporter ATP-binding protein [Anaeromyxobacteraceae bacterium]